VPGSRKGRHPNGRGGFTERFAATHGNCQLEWTIDRFGERKTDGEVIAHGH
jgi:hypothetical protein